MATLPCNNGKWSLGHYSRFAGDFTYTGSYNTAEEACAAAKLKAWAYDPVKKAYVPYNSAMQLYRVECAAENNSYLIENTYNVAFRHRPLELIVSTGSQYKNFIEILPNNKVEISANQSVTWIITNGSSSIANLRKSGSGMVFETKNLSGMVTVTAQSICHTKSLTFHIRDVKTEYISALWPALEKAGITKNKNELAAFLASSEHETGDGTNMVESSKYSLKRWMELSSEQSNIEKWLNQHQNNTKEEFDKLSDEEKLNIMYAGMIGNNQPGDGYQFRGRGGLHLTGRDAYQEFSKYMRRPDIMSNPDLVATDPHLAVQSAIWFWTIYKPKSKPYLRRDAQQGNWDEVRKAVNGGKIGKRDYRRKVDSYLNGKGVLMKP
ncbi:Predicted chitinase [Helicobacter pametensis]|nr:Predicted chitinase [Helicobacter pametensis]